MLNIVVLFVGLLSIIEAAEYCPAAGDLVATYGFGVSLYDQGWSNHGGGGAATKASFNLLGGSVDYDIDVSGVDTGVNANIYSISPVFSGSFAQTDYCDGAKTGADWCVEVDWIESNGKCGGQTTLHTRQGPGSDGCTAWGCANSYHYNGQSSFHMRVSFNYDGTWTTFRDNQIIYPSSLSPTPQGQDWSTLQSQYSTRGAVIYSSLWVGWVPVQDCGTSGSLANSHFTVSNLRINGTVVQGPTPRLCSGPNPPSPPPPPPSGGKCCYTGCDPNSCNIPGTYCDISQSNCVNECKGNWCT